MDAREVIARAVAPHGWAEAEGGGLLWTRRFDREDAFHKADDILAALAANQLAVVGREPTPKMKTAAEEALYNEYGKHSEWDDAKDVVENLDERFIWRAMFDAISPSPLPSGE